MARGRRIEDQEVIGVEAVDDQIARRKAQIDAGLNKEAFEKAAKGAIPSVIDCCDFETDKTDSKSTWAR